MDIETPSIGSATKSSGKFTKYLQMKRDLGIASKPSTRRAVGGPAKGLNSRSVVAVRREGKGGCWRFCKIQVLGCALSSDRLTADSQRFCTAGKGLVKLGECSKHFWLGEKESAVKEGLAESVPHLGDERYVRSHVLG